MKEIIFLVFLLLSVIFVQTDAKPFEEIEEVDESNNSQFTMNKTKNLTRITSDSEPCVAIDSYNETDSHSSQLTMNKTKDLTIVASNSRPTVAIESYNETESEQFASNKTKDLTITEVSEPKHIVAIDNFNENYNVQFVSNMIKHFYKKLYDISDDITLEVVKQANNDFPQFNVQFDIDDINKVYYESEIEMIQLILAQIQSISSYKQTGFDGRFIPNLTVMPMRSIHDKIKASKNYVIELEKYIRTVANNAGLTFTLSNTKLPWLQTLLKYESSIDYENGGVKNACTGNAIGNLFVNGLLNNDNWSTTLVTKLGGLLGWLTVEYSYLQAYESGSVFDRIEKW